MASQTITGPDLQYTQDNLHCYAYSGSFGASVSSQTIFNGVSGSGFIVGEFQYNQPVNPEAPQNDETSAVQIKFNGITISILKVHEGSGFTGSITQKVIIPPNTVVTATCESTDNQATMLSTFTFVGRVYEYLPVRN